MGVRDEPAGAFRYSVATPGQSVLLRGLRVPDAQLGRRKLPGTRSWASRILTSLPRDLDNPWIITERKPGSHLTDLEHSWRRIRERAGLGDVRIHGLRHTCAKPFTCLTVNTVVQRCEIKIEVDGFTVLGIGQYPVLEQVDVFGKVGAYFWDAEGRITLNSGVNMAAFETDEDGTDLVYGAGAVYELTEHVAVRAE